MTLSAPKQMNKLKNNMEFIDSTILLNYKIKGYVEYYVT